MADGRSDEASAKALLLAAIPRVRRFAYALTGAPDGADDLTQTALVRALAQIDRFEPGTRMESWLMRIVYHAAVDDARRRKRRGPHADVADVPDLIGADGRRDTVAHLDLAAARNAMARLPEDQRAVLTLVALDGMSYQEAAETLEIPIGTVMSRLSRARRAVARAVDGEGSERQ
jgi:RNA polymerase sigma-70 factor (ECF subfamily)